MGPRLQAVDASWDQQFVVTIDISPCWYGWKTQDTDVSWYQKVSLSIGKLPTESKTGLRVEEGDAGQGREVSMDIGRVPYP